MEDIQNQLGLEIIFSQKIIKYFLHQGYGNLIHFHLYKEFLRQNLNIMKRHQCPVLLYSAIKSGIISYTKYLSKYYKNKNLRIK